MHSVVGSIKEDPSSFMDRLLEENKRLIIKARETIVPCGTRVLVAREDSLKKKGSLMIITKQEGDSLPTRGTILGVGPDLKNQKLQPDTEIYFGRYAGTPINFEGTEFVLLQENEILAIHNLNVKTVE